MSLQVCNNNRNNNNNNNDNDNNSNDCIESLVNQNEIENIMSESPPPITPIMTYPNVSFDLCDCNDIESLKHNININNNNNNQQNIIPSKSYSSTIVPIVPIINSVPSFTPQPLILTHNNSTSLTMTAISNIINQQQEQQQQQQHNRNSIIKY